MHATIWSYVTYGKLNLYEDPLTEADCISFANKLCKFFLHSSFISKFSEFKISLKNILGLKILQTFLKI